MQRLLRPVGQRSGQKAIANMIKSIGQPISDEAVAEARGSAAAFCSFNPDRTIKGIYSG